MQFRFFLVLITLTMPTNGASKIKVACIGNSITEGNMGATYVPKLQTLLGSGYLVENDGVSGTTMLKKGDKSYWTNGKLKQVFALKPDIAIIKLGTNDTKPVNWNKYRGEFKTDYLSMIDTLGTLSTKPAIFLVLPVPVFKNDWHIQDSSLKKIIVIIKEIGAERKLTIIDANTPLLGFGSYFPDGVHPNAAGSDSIATIIYRGITGATGNKTGSNHPAAAGSGSAGYLVKPCLFLREHPMSKFPMIDLGGRLIIVQGSGTISQPEIRVLLPQPSP